ncbi:hypothetical protein LXL04_034323 [Taraxacum kok-saghyz]
MDFRFMEPMIQNHIDGVCSVNRGFMRFFFGMDVASFRSRSCKSAMADSSGAKALPTSSSYSAAAHDWPPIYKMSHQKPRLVTNVIVVYFIVWVVNQLLGSRHTYDTNHTKEIKQEGTQGFYVVRIWCKSYVHGLQLEFKLTHKDYKLSHTNHLQLCKWNFDFENHVPNSTSFREVVKCKLYAFTIPTFRLEQIFLLRHPTLNYSSNLKYNTKYFKPPVPKNKLKLILEGPVEAPTSSNSVVANPATDSVVVNTATDSSPVSTGLDTPPDPEIHRGPLTLSQLCKHSTGENFSVLVFKTQRLFVTVPGTRPVLPLSPNPLNGLDFRTRSANISLAPEFMFAK